MTIPFLKAHAAGNDFLLTWADRAPQGDLAATARALCNRHTGIGGDGWILLKPDSIRLFNADGGEAELSGNGTRCAAAALVEAGVAQDEVNLMTGAGPKRLRLLERAGSRFQFEMDMGLPVFEQHQVRYPLPLGAGIQEVTILNVGNPQCAVFADPIPDHWESLGAEIEGHSLFSRRTNVSFVRVLGEHSIEVRFYERGVGPTLSSGTGSTGAAVASILRGDTKSPVRIHTAEGSQDLRWDDSVYLTGPAEIVASGEFRTD